MRPVLYGRSPAGVGTPLVESLTGFLSRLCAARCVRVIDVLDTLVRPLVAPATLRPRSELSWYLTASIVHLDGMCSGAHEAVRAIGVLTGRQDLRALTMLPWLDAFSQRTSGAVCHGVKRWCARCLANWHACGVEPWEPLLWRLAAVSVCPVHRLALSERCPSCERRVRLVTDLVPLGCCERCGALLHRGDPALRRRPIDPDRPSLARSAWWVSFALGRMLAAQSAAPFRVSPDGFSQLIDMAARRLAGGTVHRLAAFLELSQTSLTRWRSGRNVPSLRHFLAVCIRLGADPVEVLRVAPGASPDLLRPQSALPWPRVEAFRPPRGTAVLPFFGRAKSRRRWSASSPHVLASPCTPPRVRCVCPTPRCGPSGPSTGSVCVPSTPSGSPSVVPSGSGRPAPRSMRR